MTAKKTAAKKTAARKTVAKKPPGSVVAVTPAVAKKRAMKVAQHRPNVPEWKVPSRPPRVFETAIIQPDPTRTDLTVGEAIPIMVLHGDRPVQAAQRLCVFPLTFRNWLARGMNEIAAMSAEQRDEPSDEEAPYVWMAMGVMRAEAEWEHWAIEEWQAHSGRDWRAVQTLMKAKFPELYSEKTAVELSGPGGGPVRVAQIPTFDEVAAALARDEAASLEQRRRELAPIETREVQAS